MLFTTLTTTLVSANTNAMQQKYPQQIIATSEAKSSEVKTIATTEIKNIRQRFMQGYASFYGGEDGFDGRVMANGDIFNSDDIHMAAHPTLPLGTKLKVTDLTTDKVLYVEVTDRMPVHKGRVIDLSRRGARYLGMHDKGIQKVELVKITDDEYLASIAKTA